MIDRVVLNILKENNFDGYESLQIENIGNVIFTYRKNDIKNEFFIVASIDQDTFVSLDENKFFSSISKSLRNTSFYMAEMDKNTSLVLCVAKDIKSKLYDSLEKTVLQTEENPYFFKKYVLTYDEKIVQEVFGEVLRTYNESSSITKYIDDIVTDPDKFKDFKINADNNESYMLLSKIIMKVPIMPVKVPNNNSIKPLTKMVEDIIISENLQKAQNLITFMTNLKDKENMNEIIDYWVKEQVNE